MYIAWSVVGRVVYSLANRTHSVQSWFVSVRKTFSELNMYTQPDLYVDHWGKGSRNQNFGENELTLYRDCLQNEYNYTDKLGRFRLKIYFYNNLVGCVTKPKKMKVGIWKQYNSKYLAATVITCLAAIWYDVVIL